MFADNLEMQGARVLTEFAYNIPVSAPAGLQQTRYIAWGVNQQSSYLVCDNDTKLKYLFIYFKTIQYIKSADRWVSARKM